MAPEGQIHSFVERRRLCKGPHILTAKRGILNMMPHVFKKGRLHLRRQAAANGSPRPSEGRGTFFSKEEAHVGEQRRFRKWNADLPSVPHVFSRLTHVRADHSHFSNWRRRLKLGRAVFHSTGCPQWRGHDLGGRRAFFFGRGRLVVCAPHEFAKRPHF